MKTFTKTVILIIALLISIEAYPQWVTDTLNDGIDNFMFGTQSIFTSKQGTIHFTCKRTLDDWENYDIIYMSKSCGEDWTIKESILEEGIVGNGPSVTSNNEDQPYIAFQKINETGSKIAISSKLNETWNFEELQVGLFDNESPDIAIDGKGNIHLAWIGTTEDLVISLCYANNIGGVWNFVVIEEAILGQFGWDAEPDIEVTSDGTAFIFYNGGDPGESYQYLATNSQPGGTTWQTERIYSDNINDFAGGILIYNDQIIHAIVNGDAGFGFPSTIFHTYKPIGGNWSIPDTVNKSFPGSYMGMGIDNEGTVYASYMKDEWNMLGDFYVANNSSGTFKDSLLMPSLGEIQNAIMTTDNDGKTHVIYCKSFDLINYSLLAMRNGECLPTQINDAEIDNPLLTVYPNPVSSVASLTIDQSVSGYASINLYDNSGKLAKMVYTGILPKGSKQFNIDFNLFPRGLYLLRLENETGVLTKKILHQ